MKSTSLAALAAFAGQGVIGHATFQVLWVNGVDYGAQCARLPLSNSPVVDVTSNDIRCNVNSGPAGYKCVVPAGAKVTIEMHQQPNDRSCSNEAIGGAHHGPVAVYLAKVSNSASSDAATGASWFKIFQDSWAKKSGSALGDDDYWGTKDLNTCCGKMDVTIPSGLAPGDYLLRAEALALHSAGSLQGGQFYITCYQITITGSGSTTVSSGTIQLPGGYAQSDPGILVNIHAAMTAYAAPGPTVYSGGSTKSAGAACRSGCESSCVPGSGPSGTASSVPVPTGGDSGCQVAKYGQCGGTDYTGCTTCVAGSTCTAVSAPYYYQCA